MYREARMRILNLNIFNFATFKFAGNGVIPYKRFGRLCLRNIQGVAAPHIALGAVELAVEDYSYFLNSRRLCKPVFKKIPDFPEP